ncbi:MAG: hypothetical protein Nkreftii_002321 [Candidatus Nitrospira kreftii]|uniref:DUF421 domain-containing protein n=1 Tax=Candidatus Nitrospira kreftii TaxID=2652173 RepID=A0A7S8IYY6_9BACT|nr:MAG: hypothetical protein Nkreftii_002321 [Candidatus Nitrospira kreftii]
MDPVIRSAAVYVALLVFLRLAGRRTLIQMTSFDFVLLLIIGEATQNALLQNDSSVTNAVLVVLTLISLDIAFSYIKQRVPIVARWIDGVPMIIVWDGRPLTDLMVKARVSVVDVLTAARESQGLERMEQIKYAVLETTGSISIIPRD